MRIISRLFFIMIIFTSCCKEDEIIIEYPTLIGSWNIVQVDSCRLSQTSRKWTIYSSHQETGSMVFNQDSTGNFIDTIRSITCGEKDFIWKHDNINSLIDFYFSNGFTIGILKTLKKDTIEFYLRDYCIDWFATRMNFYSLLKLIRTE